jgi:cell division protein FtsZ
MTGAEETAQEAEARPQPQIHSIRDEAPQADAEQERIEIPAFLRRQAN